MLSLLTDMWIKKFYDQESNLVLALALKLNYIKFSSFLFYFVTFSKQKKKMIKKPLKRESISTTPKYFLEKAKDKR